MDDPGGTGMATDPRDAATARIPGFAFLDGGESDNGEPTYFQVGEHVLAPETDETGRVAEWRIAPGGYQYSIHWDGDDTAGTLWWPQGDLEAYEGPDRVGGPVADADAEWEALRDAIDAEIPAVEPTFEEHVLHLYQEALGVLLQKHADYGAKNVSQAPGGAINGLVVRLHDKQARILNLLGQETLPNYESLRDSFLDAANYNLIACLVLDHHWPGEESA